MSASSASIARQTVSELLLYHAPRGKQCIDEYISTKGMGGWMDGWVGGTLAIHSTTKQGDEL